MGLSLIKSLVRFIVVLLFIANKNVLIVKQALWEKQADAGLARF